MKIQVAMLAIAGVFLAGPALAQSSPAQTTLQAGEQAPPAVAPGDNGNEQVCKTVKVTGSRLGKEKICKTRRDWEASEAATRQGVNDQTIRGLQADGMRGGG